MKEDKKFILELDEDSFIALVKSLASLIESKAPDNWDKDSQESFLALAKGVLKLVVKEIFSLLDKK